MCISAVCVAGVCSLGIAGAPILLRIMAAVRGRSDGIRFKFDRRVLYYCYYYYYT